MSATIVRSAIAYQVVSGRKRWIDRVSSANRVAEMLYAALRSGEEISVRAVTRGTQTRELTAEEARRIVERARDLALAAGRCS